MPCAIATQQQFAQAARCRHAYAIIPREPCVRLMNLWIQLHKLAFEKLFADDQPGYGTRKMRQGLMIIFMGKSASFTHVFKSKTLHDVRDMLRNCFEVAHPGATPVNKTNVFQRSTSN